MISSEVQRTLVKSPPELWSELSDPAALARHLGELGEVRITRAEPESLVEWEAEGTSGSVQIKPSGWGTRVTLSVNRELSAPVEADPEGGELTAEAPDTAQEASAHQSSVTAQDPVVTPQELVQEPGATAQAPEEVAEVASATAEVASATATEAIDPVPVSETEEKSEAAAETGTPFGPLGQTIEIRAVRLGPETYAGDRAHHPGDQPEQGELEAPVALVPRRGFFARLFGWRRRREIEPKPGLELDEPGEDGFDGQMEEDQWWPAPDEQGVGGEAPEDPLVPEEEPAQDQPPAAGPSAASSAIESLQARFTAMAPEPEASAEPEPEEPAAAEPEPEEPAAAEPEPAPREPGVSELEASAVCEDRYEDQPAEKLPWPGVAEVAERTTEEEPEQPVQPRSDLAGELAAAEEVAAEQVTAVLTAVLDRLGAAHHRPFSRS